MTISTLLRGAIGAAVIGLAAGVAAPAAADDLNPYLRATLGYDWSRATIFYDTDCISVVPAHLYGCGPGIDGLPTGAYGDFGRSAFFEVGAGIEPSPGVRIETTLGYRPGFAFVGNTNFAGSGTVQPTTGTVDQFNITNFVYLDLLKAGGIESRFQPFIGAGFGISRNAISAMRIEIPAFQGVTLAYRTTPDGVNWSATWSLVAGVGFELSDRATIELAYRFNNLGEVVTDAGPLFVQHANGSTASVMIGETVAPLTSHALTLSFRWAL